MKKKTGIALFVAILVFCLGGIPTIATATTPPVSEPNGPYTGVVGDTITFDGTASYDPDEPQDFIIQYEWDFENDGVFDATGAVVTHSWSVPFSGFTALRVTDTFGNTDTNIASTTIEELPPPPSVPDMTSWGIMVVAIMLAGLITLVLRRRVLLK